MIEIVVAVIAGLFSLGAVIISYVLGRVRRDLDDCLRERRQLKQVLQLTVSSLVGLLPATKRDELLIAVERALDEAA